VDPTSRQPAGDGPVKPRLAGWRRRLEHEDSAGVSCSVCTVDFELATALIPSYATQRHAGKIERARLESNGSPTPSVVKKPPGRDSRHPHRLGRRARDRSDDGAWSSWSSLHCRGRWLESLIYKRGRGLLHLRQAVTELHF
jgi:hypothetical protein